MSSIDRPLSGEPLVFELGEQGEEVADSAILERNGHNARTLVKDGPMRVVLIAIAPGGEIPEHEAAGPITVQPVGGRIRFTVGGRHHDLEPGRMLSLAGGVRHRVFSEEGGAFLLTIAHREPAGEATQAPTG